MRIFLSYSAQDRDLAAQLRSSLAEHGFDVWPDELLRPGESLAGAITGALENADAYVVLLTRNSSGPEWPLFELGAALASDKLVVPVVADTEAVVPFVLKDRVYLDYTTPAAREKAADILREALQHARPRDYTASSGALSAVEHASAALESERAAHERALLVRRDSAWWHQGFVAAVGVLAAVAGVISALDISAVGLLVPPLVAVLGSAIGFYFGSNRADDL